MRVLLVAGEYPPQQGGLGDFTRCLAGALVNEGCRVTVLAPREATPVDPAWTFEVRAEAGGWGPADVLRVRRLAQGYDVVNLQYQAAAYGMRVPIHLLPWACGRVPLVTTFHDLRVPYLFPKAGPVRRWAVRALMRGSAAAIVTNEEDVASARADSPQARLHLVRIGSNVDPVPVGPEERRSMRARYEFPDEAVVVGYFAFLNASKGGMELVRAVAEGRRQGVDLRLLFIGGDVGASDPTNAAYAARVFAEAEALGLGTCLYRTGYLDQAGVSAAFAAADICALPFLDGASYRRGSLMAALAHGMPVVTTTPAVPVAGLSEGESVRLVAPGDVAALAKALVDLAGQPEERRRLGEAAQRLSRQFEWPHIARDTLRVYRQVAQSR
ncbi:MAG: glycosyltransferase family 4 protein [Anaerolineae bacterium]|nr:glycosyltransferase family 4 protein [Anaerolineae bacterium]